MCSTVVEVMPLDACFADLLLYGDIYSFMGTLWEHCFKTSVASVNTQNCNQCGGDSAVG